MPGSKQLVPTGIVLAACWAHTRRKFYDVHQATGSPIAAEALRRIGELYAIEDTIRGRSAELRRTVRRELAQPLVDTLKTWLEAELHRVPPRSPLADAIRYALVRWEALCLYLDDGRVELDTNTVERAIRPIALGRKNHLFAGSDAIGRSPLHAGNFDSAALAKDAVPYTGLGNARSGSGRR
jgi:transposase